MGSSDDESELNIPLHLHTFELLTTCRAITVCLEDPNHLMMNGDLQVTVALREFRRDDAALIMLRVLRSQRSSL